jgi:choline transport protein
MNAITLTCLIACALALINIGSKVAFNAIISLMLVALTFTYIVAIACVLWRRTSNCEKHRLPEARWSMGRRTGVVVNIGALLYSIFAFFWCFWPNSTSRGAAYFNWSVVLFVLVGFVALAMWFAKGRKEYRGPVAMVVGRDER